MAGIVNDDFHDILAELVARQARFLIVGAHALAVHGVPRATVDIDIWIDPHPDNVRRVWMALAEFGAPLDDLHIQESDLTRPDCVAQLGLPPNRIDILTGVTGLTFDDAWTERTEAEVEGVRAPILGFDALIRNKRASGRHKDLGDVEALLGRAGD